MDCPRCNWKLKNLTEWVDQNGYHGQSTCSDCKITITASMDLFQAYNSAYIPDNLLLETEQLLLASGRLATPP
jgi:hypothetical protein